MLRLQLNDDTLSQLGLRADGRIEWIVPLLPSGDAAAVLGDAAPTGLFGTLEASGLRLERADGARSPPLRLGSDGQGLDMPLFDAEGRVWLRIRHGMRSPEAAHGLRLFTADLRAGPALAGWLGLPRSDDFVAGLGLDLPLQARASEKSCAAPNWPGTEGFVTDVLLTNIDVVSAPRCRRLDAPTERCDGPGGVEGEVVVAPAATLANSSAANATEVPWYQQFSAPTAPYGNDQHPFLVWNLYRIDADGTIRQIGRSALKHAFATANTGCLDATCTGGGWSQILGRGCSDLYSVSSNDCSRFLASRREVIAASGRWGRCGSLFDADCDGVPDPRIGHPQALFCSATVGSPANDGYGLRLVVAESGIDPTRHPGARWFLDAWYVVRDDADLFNTMGWRELSPTFDPPEVTSRRWRLDPAAFVSGALLPTWTAMPGASHRLHAVVSTDEGQAGLGSRVERLPDGRFRYTYALMNYSLGRAVTEGNEPNLRVLRNLGIDALAVDLGDVEAATGIGFEDGDAHPGNDWNAGQAGSQLRWSAGDGADLAWGSLLQVSFVSRRPPAAGQIDLDMAEAGAPGSYPVGALVPDPEWLFGNGYE